MYGSDDRTLTTLARLVGSELERSAGTLHAGSEQYLEWLARDLRASQTSAERRATELAASAFVKRAVPRLTALRLEQRLPARRLEYKPADSVCDLQEALRIAALSGHAPLLDLRVAAGPGCELWEEPCEQWIEVPTGIGDGRYLGLKVSGDSMAPLLEPGDVILVKLDAVPVCDDVVVARRDEDGYVVKRVASITRSKIELASLNPRYETISLPRDPHSVLGTVIARFHHA